MAGIASLVSNLHGTRIDNCYSSVKNTAKCIDTSTIHIMCHNYSSCNDINPRYIFVTPYFTVMVKVINYIVLSKCPTIICNKGACLSGPDPTSWFKIQHLKNVGSVRLFSSGEVSIVFVQIEELGDHKVTIA